MSGRGSARISPEQDAARIAFGKRLRAWMATAGLARKDVANLCCVSDVTVAKWLSGEATPSEQNLHTLERAGFEAPRG